MSVSMRLSATSDVNLPAWLCGEGPDGDIVLSTRIRLARNIVGHRFPRHARLSDRRAVFGKVADALADLPVFAASPPVNFTGLPLRERLLLVERRVASGDLARGEGDRGLLADGEGRISVMVNEEDHLRLQCLGSGCAPGEFWKMLDTLDEMVGSRLPYAYDRRFGFLTSCPTNAGTGLRVSFLLHLPGLVLTRTIDAVLQAASQMGIATRGFFGEHSQVVGNFYQLSNQAAMGNDEAGFVTHARDAVMAVCRAERQARERLLEQANLALVDKIMRAYGIMRYAKTLSVVEFLNLSSALRLGIDCGFLAGVTTAKLNAALLRMQPAHLRQEAGAAFDEAELAIRRAKIGRKLLAGSRARNGRRRGGGQTAV